MTTKPTDSQITFMYTICLGIRALQLAVVKTAASNAALLEMIAQLNSCGKEFGIGDADAVMAQFNQTGHAIILGQLIMVHGLPDGVELPKGWDTDTRTPADKMPESKPTFH